MVVILTRFMLATDWKRRLMRHALEKRAAKMMTKPSFSSQYLRRAGEFLESALPFRLSS
jgi:hypothetical protein